jgi:hypothetical protein
MTNGVVGNDTAWYVTEPSPVFAHYGQADGAQIVNLLRAGRDQAAGQAAKERVDVHDI